MTAELVRVKKEKNWESVENDNNYNKHEENVRVKEERDLEGNARGQYLCVEIEGVGECADLSTEENVREESIKKGELDYGNKDVFVCVKEERSLEDHPRGPYLCAEIEKDKECSNKLSSSINVREEYVKETELKCGSRDLCGNKSIYLNSEVYVSFKIKREFEPEPVAEVEQLQEQDDAFDLQANRKKSNEADAETTRQGCYSEEGQNHSKSNETVFGLKKSTITSDRIDHNEPHPHQKTQDRTPSDSIHNPRKIRKSKTLERPHKCDVCGKRFAKKSNLSLHILIHKELVQYPCDVCKKQYSSYYNLKRHKKIHTGEKPHRCDVCDRRFTDPCNLATHIKRIHSNTDSADTRVDKKYSCKTCNKLFPSPSHLNSHKRVHTGEKPYPCSYCEKQFTSASNLKRHKMSHTGEKPYTCDICNKQFMEIHTLTKHIQNHMGVVYIYACDICKKKFKDPRTLARHKQIHKGETFTCEICNKTYFSSHTFLNHKWYHKLKAEGRYKGRKYIRIQKETK